jgi:hypothetical protein
MSFSEIMNLVMLALALINILLAGYYRIAKDDTVEATFHTAAATVLYLLATH